MRCAPSLVAIPFAAIAIAIGGCASYAPAPIDLDAHRTAVDHRLTDPRPMLDLADQMRAAADPATLAGPAGVVPVRFHLADGLTAAEGELVALVHNADLRMARLSAGVARATADHAGLWEDPEFGFDAAQILSPSSLFEFGATVGLTIPISGRLEVERERAGAAHETELRRLVAAEWATRAELRRAWASWVSATRRETMLAEVLVQVQGIVTIAEALERAGELSRVEGRLFRVELAARRGEQIAARLETTRTRLALLALMGLGPDAAIELVAAAPGLADTELGGAAPLDRLTAANPELAVQRAAYRVAEETLRLEVRRQYPDLTIGGGYGQEDDDRLLLGFSLPIPILNANRQAIAEARAARELARAATETTWERLAHRLAAVTATRIALGEQRHRVASEVAPMLAEQAAEIERIASLGELDVLLLLESVTRQYDARTRLLELQRAEAHAAIDLAELLGPRSAAEPAPVSIPVPVPGSDHTPTEGGAA